MDIELFTSLLHNSLSPSAILTEQEEIINKFLTLDLSKLTMEQIAHLEVLKNRIYSCESIRRIATQNVLSDVKQARHYMNMKSLEMSFV